jgi:hypothetical protein
MFEGRYVIRYSYSCHASQHIYITVYTGYRAYISLHIQAAQHIYEHIYHGIYRLHSKLLATAVVAAGAVHVRPAQVCSATQVLGKHRCVVCLCVICMKCGVCNMCEMCIVCNKCAVCVLGVLRIVCAVCSMQI